MSQATPSMFPPDEATREDVTALLVDLIAVPSVNPRGHARAAETPLATFVAGWARENGLDARLEEVVDGRCNVIVTLRGSDPSKIVLLETHLDTVEVEHMTVPAFDARIDGGRLYGRGACDAKGPLAAFLIAMRDIARSGRLAPHSIVLAGVVDEEHEYRGVTSLLTSTALAAEGQIVGAVVGEPTDLRMVVAHKGCMRCHIVASGPGGHSSRPWGVVNPIESIADVVTYLASDVVPQLADRVHPLVGAPTLVASMISGGSGPNTVPNECRVTLDRRTLPGEDPREVWAELRAQIAGRFGDEVVVEEPFLVDLSLDTDPADEFVALVGDALSRAGRDGTPIGTGWGSDASKLAAAGVPAVVLGPGSIDDAHKPDESIDLDELATAVGIVRTLLMGPDHANGHSAEDGESDV